MQVITWKQLDPFGSYTYYHWLSLKKCSFGANYSQLLRQDILKYFIEMLWIMSSQSGWWEQILFLTLYKHMQCSLCSFWMILYQVLINFLTCMFFAKGLKRTLWRSMEFCVHLSLLWNFTFFFLDIVCLFKESSGLYLSFPFLPYGLETL